MIAKQVLEKINVNLQQSSFLTLMLDETTVSNKEQIIVVL